MATCAPGSLPYASDHLLVRDDYIFGQCPDDSQKQGNVGQDPHCQQEVAVHPLYGQRVKNKPVEHPTDGGAQCEECRIDEETITGTTAVATKGDELDTGLPSNFLS
jgi:hypothetical protein